MENRSFTAIVLAAGKGVRMKSSLPKVLHEVKGYPLIHHVLKNLRSVKHINQIIIVAGYKADEVKQYVTGNFPDIDFVIQTEILGTGHAVGCARDKIAYPNVLVLCADVPLITSKTISRFISSFFKTKKHCFLLSAKMEEENQLGEILRDDQGKVCAICEKIELTREQASKEVNSGMYIFDKDVLFENLPLIEKNKKKKEYFLTDIINVLYRKNYKVESYFLENNEEILGINNVFDLNIVEKVMQKRIVGELISKEVRILDADTTFIDGEVKVGPNTIIYPFTFIEKDVIIGSNCLLGPFIHIRKGSRVKNNTCLGNFVEINRSVLGKNVTMKHFGYVGDTVIEDGVNIGAGTVVANYDGKRKNKTLIKKGAFIGSDTILIAPLTVGKQAVTGAGSVVTKDVMANTVVAGVPARLLKKRES